MENAILLNGKCRLYYYEAGAKGIDSPEKLAGMPWIKSKIPSNVELDFIEAGLLPKDIFMGNNILKVQELEKYDFWYELEFQAEAFKRSELVFRGVDTVAEYFLNGRKFGESFNMLHEHIFEVTGYLKPGKNVLHVKISSAVKYAAAQEYFPFMYGFDCAPAGQTVRKAPHMYGWDICCRAVSAGIFRDVYLREIKETEFRQLYISTVAATEAMVSAVLFYELDMPFEYFGKAKLTFTGSCGAHSFTKHEILRFKARVIQFDLPGALLWWPKDYGEQNLYDIRVSVAAPDGSILAEKSLKAGFRKAEVKYSRLAGKENGGYFYVTVNDVKIMCKGTNWVPLSPFHSLDKSKYPAAFGLLGDIGCNIVRCWGGNVYEDDEFFDFCDREGILVWQDFAMACNITTHDGKFIELLKREIQCVVRRIRNHPSLLLYCGDNEVDYSYYANGMDPAENSITRQHIPKTVFYNDPHRQYLPSSPFFNPAVVAGKDLSAMPEDHLWGPRDHYKSEYYKSSKAHFISEIGIHGCPSVESIKKFITPGALWPCGDNEEWITHATSPTGKAGMFAYRIGLMTSQIKNFFGEAPKDIYTFSKMSQIVQAESMKYFIESVRLRKWDKSGIIWWNILDAWPQFSDAVTDSFFCKKLAYYYIKNVQRPLCPILRETQDGFHELVIANDGNRSYSGTYEITDVSGKALKKGSFDSLANCNAVVEKIKPANPGIYFLKLHTDNGIIINNHYLSHSGYIDYGWYAEHMLNGKMRYA